MRKHFKKPKPTAPAKVLPPVTGRLIGYARVSTEDQNLQAQIDALSAVGVLDDNMHAEKRSAAAKRRPALEDALADCRPGDTLVVQRLDRLGRNLRWLINTIHDLTERGVNIRALSGSFDTTTAQGRLLLGLFAVLAEFERELVKERTMFGLNSHRKRGGTVGMARQFTPEQHQQMVEMKKAGKSYDQIAKHFKCHRQTAYNYIANRPIK